MLESAVKAAGMEDIFTHLLSAHTVQKFKCHPAVYQMGPDSLGTPLGDILFVSSNCWDVAGATWYGYNTFWVNRAKAPLEELDVKPCAEGNNLTDLLTYIEEQEK
mmetsp:Transcript_25277/g.24181  ORF Transcript_25277/g.24181 Transcript_25277/m.24181 type:complete len:105 (-) Transcript_25277:434-748(-)